MFLLGYEPPSLCQHAADSRNCATAIMARRIAMPVLPDRSLTTLEYSFASALFAYVQYSALALEPAWHVGGHRNVRHRLHHLGGKHP